VKEYHRDSHLVCFILEEYENGADEVQQINFNGDNGGVENKGKKTNHHSKTKIIDRYFASRGCALK
jgi:hypothetical protein